MSDYKYGKDIPWMIKNTELLPISTENNRYLVKRKWDKDILSLSQNPVGVCQELAHTLLAKIQSIIPKKKEGKYKFSVVSGNSPDYFNQPDTNHLFITGENNKHSNKYGKAIIDPSSRKIESTSTSLEKKYKVKNKVQESSQDDIVLIQESSSEKRSVLVPLGYVGDLHPTASEDIKNRIVEVGVEKLPGLPVDVVRLELRKPDGSYENDSVRKKFVESLQIKTPELSNMEKIFKDVSLKSNFSSKEITEITSQIKKNLNLSSTPAQKSKSSHLVDFLNNFNISINKKADISSLTQEEKEIIFK